MSLTPHSPTSRSYRVICEHKEINTAGFGTTSVWELMYLEAAECGQDPFRFVLSDDPEDDDVFRDALRLGSTIVFNKSLGLLCEKIYPAGETVPGVRGDTYLFDFNAKIHYFDGLFQKLTLDDDYSIIVPVHRLSKLKA
jgi:hypothetical protein